VIGVLLTIVAVAAGFMIGGGDLFTTTEPEDTGEDGVPAGRDQVECGKAATLHLNAYDQSADTQTEVYPSYYVFDKNGNLLVDGASANTSSTTTCNELTISNAGEDASYYLDKKVVDINAETETTSLDAWTITTESNLAITGYDDSMSGLTAETQANKSVEIDYEAGSFGADECNTLNFKFKNGQADSTYRLGAVCVGWGGDVDNIVLSDSGWEEGYLPDELNDATITTHADDNTSYTGDWKKCYVPSGQDYIQFDEWDSKMLEMTVCAGSNAPTENTGDFGALLFVDAGYEKGKDGQVYLDYFVHDNDEEVTDVGLAESYTSSPGGLTSSAAFELH
jgi:hypothetical protein